MRWVAVVVVMASACSAAGMRAHQPGLVTPECTESMLPPIADGVMFVAASVLAASDLYAHRFDDSYCGPGPNGEIPIDGCGYEGEGSIGFFVAVPAGVSAIIGANRYSECHAAYDSAETAQRHPIARAGTSTLTKMVAYASMGVSALFGAMAATLFSRY